MKKIMVATTVLLFAMGSALAQEACEAQAVGKDGKLLAGAAKTSFMKKCKTDACEEKAVGSDGRKLSGAAKNSFMKKCQAG
ncbi:hypothetical protein GJ654_16770 [Rhodoblastus acidophilus]|jgi:hypothetical protein|uniref:PsiF repeat-containing protein n=1 Tax=Rhodoblastus acidophilus TaxID=1074 RepID=A0A6N8DU20_RHOAC|nr:hypothetical protein [Rhodoblastus acidophilus]MCW2275968.1 opacity protein-like surface antigen [Rhodoblastus acidophilus]MTV32641.1 hypothetical protein [Rhodoblastus acidophilus]